MAETIRIQTELLLSLAMRLDGIAQEMRGVALPSADGIGNGEIAASLELQRRRLSQVAESARDCGRRVRAAEQILADCERGLTGLSDAIIQSDRIVWGNMPESKTPDLASLATIMMTVLSLLNGELPANLAVYTLIQRVKRFLNQDGAFSAEGHLDRQTFCEAQRQLALDIYDGFENGAFAERLRAEGYEVVTIQHPSGVAAYRLGSDGVPEIQIVYRGTSTSEDKMVDANVAVNAEGFHTGFADASERFLSALREQHVSTQQDSATFGQLLDAAAQGQPTRFNITGHSLGAAEAQLTAASLLKSGVPSQNVTAFTFATPVVATPEAIKQNYLPGSQIVNIINLQDWAVTNAGNGGTRFISNAGNLGVTYALVGDEGWLHPKEAHVQGYDSIPYEELGRL